MGFLVDWVLVVAEALLGFFDYIWFIVCDMWTALTVSRDTMVLQLLNSLPQAQNAAWLVTVEPKHHPLTNLVNNQIFIVDATQNQIPLILGYDSCEANIPSTLHAIKTLVTTTCLHRPIQSDDKPNKEKKQKQRPGHLYDDDDDGDNTSDNDDKPVSFRPRHVYFTQPEIAKALEKWLLQFEVIGQLAPEELLEREEKIRRETEAKLRQASRASQHTKRTMDTRGGGYYGDGDGDGDGDADGDGGDEELQALLAALTARSTAKLSARMRDTHATPTSQQPGDGVGNSVGVDDGAGRVDDGDLVTAASLKKRSKRVLKD